MLTEFTTECVQRTLTYVYTGRLKVPGKQSEACELDKLFSQWKLKDSLSNNIKERLIEAIQAEPCAKKQRTESAKLVPIQSSHPDSTKGIVTPHVSMDTTTFPSGVRQVPLDVRPTESSCAQPDSLGWTTGPSETQVRVYMPSVLEIILADVLSLVLPFFSKTWWSICVLSISLPWQRLLTKSLFIIE